MKISEDTKKHLIKKLRDYDWDNDYETDEEIYQKYKDTFFANCIVFNYQFKKFVKILFQTLTGWNK